MRTVEAVALEVERIPDMAFQVIHTSVGDMRIRTAGIVLTMKDADGNKMVLEMTRDTLGTLLAYASSVRCDG